jgi:quinol monooxygenase YgiN
MNQLIPFLALTVSLALSTTRATGQVSRITGLLHPSSEARPATLVLYTAKLPIRPESREVFLTAATALGELVRREAGCLDFALYEAPRARGTFFLVEEWANEMALATHRRQPYEQACQQQLPALLAAPATATAY